MSLDKKAALQEMEAIEQRQKELRRIIEEADRPKTIFERVTNIPSAIIELGESDPEVKEYRLLQRAGASAKTIKGQEIALFCKAMNEGTKMTFKDINQQKWFVWFDFNYSVGSGFVDSVDDHCYASDSFAARHSYSSEKKARHGAKCIEQIYYDYLVD